MNKAAKVYTCYSSTYTRRYISNQSTYPHNSLNLWPTSATT